MTQTDVLPVGGGELVVPGGTDPNTIALNFAAPGTALAPTPAELMNQLAGTFGQVEQDLATGIRRITFSGKNFTFCEGNNKTVHMLNGAPAPWLDIVIINMAPDRHCIWYAKDFDPRNPSDSPPDAVWLQKQGAPPNVPAYVTTTKRVKDGVEMNHFQLNQRVVVALLKQDYEGGPTYIDTKNLWGMDISGMSIFTKQETPPAYTFQGLLREAQRLGTFCSRFAVRMIFAPGISVPVVRFSPMIDTTTQEPLLFDEATYNRLCNLALSQPVLDMLEIKTKDCAPPAAANQDASLGQAQQAASVASAAANAQAAQAAQAAAAQAAAAQAQREAQARAQAELAAQAAQAAQAAPAAPVAHIAPGVYTSTPPKAQPQAQPQPQQPPATPPVTEAVPAANLAAANPDVAALLAQADAALTEAPAATPGVNTPAPAADDPLMGAVNTLLAGV